MKKGFTLVELLAVVIILGILAVVIVPKIQQTIKDSKKNTYEASAHAIDREVEVFYENQKINKSNFSGCEYDFTTGNNTCEGFEFKGQKPDEGKIEIYPSGESSFAIKYDDFCYVKRQYSDNIVTISSCENINSMIPQIVTSGDGLYVSQTEPGRLIYRGTNPNNWLWLDENGNKNKENTELYRIISYESDGTIKVVRNQMLNNNILWDQENNRGQNDTYCNDAPTYGCNAWGDQTNTYYNGNPINSNFHYEYYINSNASSLTSSPNTGAITKNSTLNNFLNNDWLNSTQLNKYIVEHMFNVGSVYYVNTLANSDKGIIKEKEEEKLLKWKGKIGLLNATEIVESSTNSTCTSLFSNYRFNPDNTTNEQDINGVPLVRYEADETPCAIENWNSYVGEYIVWTLTAYSNTTFDVWSYNGTNGLLGSTYANSTTLPHAIKPVFYLKSSTALDGEGTQSSPYYIAE